MKSLVFFLQLLNFSTCFKIDLDELVIELVSLSLHRMDHIPHFEDFIEKLFLFLIFFRVLCLQERI